MKQFELSPELIAQLDALPDDRHLIVKNKQAEIDAATRLYYGKKSAAQIGKVFGVNSQSIIKSAERQGLKV